VAYSELIAKRANKLLPVACHNWLILSLI